MDNSNSIDQSIIVCEKSIASHKSYSRNFLFLIIGVIGFLIGLEVAIQLYDTIKRNEIVIIYNQLGNDLENYKDLYGFYPKDTVENNKELVDEARKIAVFKIDLIDKALRKLSASIEQKRDGIYNYILYGIFILVFGVLTSFYRFHQKEIAKYEHYLIGFHRIRVAANNSSTGFEDYVRQSLTVDAFAFETTRLFFSKDKKVENPVPGHPTLEISTLLINKILDAIEIKSKEKGSKLS